MQLVYNYNSHLKIFNIYLIFVIVTLRAEYSLLCSSHPNESLSGIKDYMNIKGSFADGKCLPYCIIIM